MTFNTAVCDILSLNTYSHCLLSPHTAPPLTPQRLRATSIIQDDFSKPRSETAGDIMGGGEEGGDQTDWGEPIESTSPQDSLRIRSFTLIAPVRSKPE